jgi:hypothetical protein
MGRHAEQAMILDSLIERTVAFLEGRGTVPYVLGPIDDETKEFVPSLVRINRLGLVTTCSQPGAPMQTCVWPDGSRHEAIQRSFMTGLCTLCTNSLAEFLHRRINTTDMVFVSRPLAFKSELKALDRAGVTGLERWTVTRLDGRPHTHVGHWIDELAQWERGLTPWGQTEIAAKCSAVAIMDPVWGRHAMHSDGLLPHVLKALSDSDRPRG